MRLKSALVLKLEILSPTFKQRSQETVSLDRTNSAVLSNDEFGEKYRKPNDEDHQQVRHQERSTAVAEGQVREAPNISQTDGIIQAGQDELHWVAPVASFDEFCCRSLDRI